MSGRSSSLGCAAARSKSDASRAERASADQRGLLNRVPAILYTADAGEHGTWYFVSPQIETILGFSPEEWCADPNLWASRLHPDDRPRVLEAESEIGAGEPSDGAAEYRLLHPDGRVVWVRDDALLVE